MHITLTIMHCACCAAFIQFNFIISVAEIKIKFGENPVWMEVHAFGVANK